MARYNSLTYANVWRKRSSNLRRNASKASIKLADQLKREIKSRAPKKTGNLMSSIRRIKNRVLVGGVDPQTGFPYIHWINQTRGMNMRTLRYKNGAYIPASKSYNGKGFQLLPPNSVAVYGKTPSHWNFTGQAQFVDKSILVVREEAKRTVRKAFRNALEINVTG